MILTNQEFLSAVFRTSQDDAHVTGFLDDPSDITSDRRGICWAGGSASEYRLLPGTNQYFTISTFNRDDQGKPRRRKALYKQTHCVVLDDVREKLSIEVAQTLPAPSWVMETSAGSEQWGYILTEPCTDAGQIDNLNDGLIASDLAPDGKDPGQRGITRYVRLPEGVNTKASKRNADGSVWNCRMLSWQPWVTVTLAQIAAPFAIDLHAARRESRVDGAAEIPDHPLLNTPHLEIKEVRSAGRFDVVCPWVTQHTGQSDDGAAIFTNDDGSMGFKCHHGTCQDKTGRDLMDHIEIKKPGFRAEFKAWQFMHNVKKVMPAPAPLSFMAPRVPPAPISFMAAPPAPPAPPEEQVNFEDIKLVISKQILGKTKNTAAYEFLHVIDDMDHGTRLMHHNDLRDIMGWSKRDLDAILLQQRKAWYAKKVDEDNTMNFYDEYVYVAEQNQYYHQQSNLWLTVDGFRNRHLHLDIEVHNEALANGRVEKVDRLDYIPGSPKILTDNGIKYLNTFTPFDVPLNAPGDVTPWLNHFKVLGIEKDMPHFIKWMAHTIRFPDKKINHALLLAGGEGIGKDLLFHAFFKMLGNQHKSIHGSMLLDNFNDFIVGTKNVHINELEMGDHREAKAVTNKLKPYCTAPPTTLRVNPKNVKSFQIQNLCNVTIFSNNALPLVVSRDTRRYYAVWSDMNPNGTDGEILPEWRKYFNEIWEWMDNGGGWQAISHYLMTQVDLSDFNPGESPKVTEFMRDMREASADPVGEAVREVIEKRHSLFESDILTIDDAHRSLRSAVSSSDLVNSVKYLPSIQILGKIMRQEQIGIKVRVVKNGVEKQLWIVRNHETLRHNTPGELLRIYENNMEKIRTQGASPVLTLVSGE